MGLMSHLLIADASDANAMAASDDPIADREGFSFQGLDNIWLCTLLSLLESGSADHDFDKYLDLVELLENTPERGPWVYTVHPKEVNLLARAASLEEDELNDTADLWAKTEELEGIPPSDVKDLLRTIGDLADTAALQDKCLILWIGY
jgi:hypothetical protein